MSAIYTPPAGPPAQSLGVEPVDRSVLRRRPRDTARRIISRSLLLSVLLSAAVIIAGTLWVFNREVSAALYFIIINITEGGHSKNFLF